MLGKLFQHFFCVVFEKAVVAHFNLYHAVRVGKVQPLFHKQFSVCFGSWVVYLVGGEYM